MTPSPGARIGPYLLRDVLGTGGMGQVFRAAHVETGAEHAVKCILGLAGAEEQLRFVREAQALARVDGHKNVLRVHAAGVERGVSWLAMELATGGSLERQLRGGPLAPAAAIALARDLAGGLAHVHARGVLHRDLKPENVLYTADGTPKLADFGLASLRDAPSLTKSGCVLGTPAYMPPEQARGERLLDERADVYSLGAVLYCALTARPPFSMGANVVQLLTRVAAGDFPPPRAHEPGIPAWLEAVVLRAMAREPAARYPSAAAFAEALARGPAGRRSARVLPVVAGALVVAVLAGGAWATARRDDVSPGQPRQAERPATDPAPSRPAAPVTRLDVERLLDGGQPDAALAAVGSATDASPREGALLAAEAHLERDRFAEARAALRVAGEADLAERTLVYDSLVEPGDRDAGEVFPLYALVQKPPALTQATARLRAALARAEQRLLCRPHVLAPFDSNFLLVGLSAARERAPGSPFARDLQALWLVAQRPPDVEGAARALREDAPEHVRFFVRAAQDVATPGKVRRGRAGDEAPAALAEGPPSFVRWWGAEGKQLGSLLRDLADRRAKDLLHVAFTRRDQDEVRAAAIAGARAWLPATSEPELLRAQVALLEGARDEARDALAPAPSGLGMRALLLAELRLQEGNLPLARELLDELITRSELNLQQDHRGNGHGVFVLVDFWTARALARALAGDLDGADADVAQARALEERDLPVRLPWRSPDATAAAIAWVRAGDARWRVRAPPPTAW